ncbi:hypothetical protein [Pseudonocardia acaciae]|uniref:hypothetical protein n=1 Tax=Pseudonocardia acaciae TaxID=551276 RepID=UPI0004910CC9|nr:hypothetical protein [Pseudonocardia acaciae]
MVNKRFSGDLGAVNVVAWVYVALVLGTLVALAVLSEAASRLATEEAWGHAVIVAVFAVVLPLRLRAANRGSARALRAVGIIAAVLLVVNVVEASLPGAFPTWMRGEMVAVAAVMLLLLGCVARARRQA